MESPLPQGWHRTWHTEQALNSRQPLPTPPPEGCDQDIRYTTVPRSPYLGATVLVRLAEVSLAALHTARAKEKPDAEEPGALPTQTNKGKSTYFL